MDQIIEIIRRFLQAIIWSVGIIASVAGAIVSFQADNGEGTVIVLLFSLACLGLTWFLSKVINWIFLK